MGIVSALPEEQADLRAHLKAPRSEVIAGRECIQGNWRSENNADALEVVCALSGIGKVAAATTATSLIMHYHCDALLFTGVAGGVGADVRVGDVVIGTGFVQHDMNAAPLFPRYELPLYGKAVLAADAAMTATLAQVCECVLPQLAAHAEISARIAHHDKPRCHQGLIASGDEFLSTKTATLRMMNDLQSAQLSPLCVEMEGAAIAQVCHDFKLPFAVMRTISDRADDEAHADFTRFVAEVASRYSEAVLHALCDAWSNSAPH